MRLRLWQLGIFVFALIPRALAGRFVTIDEAYHWFDRVGLFVTALAQGEYAATNLIGHPGVTTLWLGALGSWVEQLLVALGIISGTDAALHRMLLRIPVAIACSLCIALAYLMLCRLFEERIALLACLFWAGEPFLVAHAQLLHLDALLTSFMILSLLAILVYVAAPRTKNHRTTEPQNRRTAEPTTSNQAPKNQAPHDLRNRYLYLSAMCGGLALLTKSPSVVGVAMVGLILLVAALRNGLHQPMALLRAVGLPLMVWLLVAGLVWVALWPAAWVDLPGAIGRVVFQAQADGGSPHGWGNYFLGHAVSDPGWLFYPVAIGLRLAPWTTLGLLSLLGLAFARPTRYANKQWFGQIPGTAAFALLMLIVFGLLFLLAMSIPPKKFDRYALPIFPVLNILAAVGIVRVWDRMVAGSQNATTPGHTGARFASNAIIPALCVLLAANLVWYHPYELAYFNPLLGGGRVAAWAVPVGWGEGHELVADYVAQQPNGADKPIAALYEPVINPLAPAGSAPMNWAYQPGKVDYAVLYIDQIQRGYKPELVSGLLGKVAPIHIVTIHGIEYAYVYQLAPPVAQPLAASFGDAIRLRGYDLDASQVRTSSTLTVTLQWEGTGTPAIDYTMFVHILDTNGNKVGQVDVPPGGVRWPTSRWGARRYITNIQQVPIRADAPDGTYHITIGVYNPDGFARLPLTAPPGSHDASAGPDALQVAVFELR
jgi:4-amino-4-deoxy-L-arabinose transferase-like glycosyltransferase